jgi:hypothetical protein
METIVATVAGEYRSDHKIGNVRYGQVSRSSRGFVQDTVHGHKGFSGGLLAWGEYSTRWKAAMQAESYEEWMAD